MIQIKDIFISDKVLNSYISICGWIRQLRKQSDIVFININDGTNMRGLQVIVHKDNVVLFNKVISELNNGCYIECYGEIVKSPAREQNYEMNMKELKEYTKCSIEDYPLKKSLKLDNLRQYIHLRARSKVFGAIFRIRNTVFFKTHTFFQNNKFFLTDPNIITTNECEGGAGAFHVTEIMQKDIRNIPHTKDYKLNYTKDHFKKETFLTVSSQLQLEAMACAMGNVYTMNKSFRSEHSTTNKHMSEFSHLEIELVTKSMNELMRIAKAYIKYIIECVYKNHIEELTELDKFICKGILNRYDKLRTMVFYEITYKDAIELIKKKSNICVEYGEDLSSEMETFLTEYYNGFVFVTMWPLSIKSFYMKQTGEKEIEEDTCESFDLLIPYGIGELIGGSMREDNLEKLIYAMKMKHINCNELSWYLDLRKYGTVPHGGFGLGLERFLMLLTGMKNIKDVVPFPVYYQNCQY